MRIFVLLPGLDGEYLTLWHRPSDLVRNVKEKIQDIFTVDKSESAQSQMQTARSSLQEKKRTSARYKVKRQILIMDGRCLDEAKKVGDYITRSDTMIELSFDLQTVQLDF